MYLIKMIPKYIFDNQQTDLNIIKLSVKDRLTNYREYLYKDFYEKLKILKIQKESLIKSYLIAIKEIDREINAHKELNKLMVKK